MDKIIVAASTHWDREWYRTFQDFQIRLCDLMNRLLDLLEQDKDFKCYSFDGQSVVLDDYLEIYPQNKERIKKLVKSGKLVFGPLYNLPDEFLSGGEGLIRNFLIGNEVCKDIGGRMRAGYVPDNFGHISQLPQILQGVGIDNAFFFRGTNVDTVQAKEFYWEGPDGSCVLAEYMMLGYWSLKSWGKLGKSAKEHFKSAWDTLKEHSRLDTFLLINGSDHLYQDPEFSAMMQEVKAEFPEAQIENGSIEDYAALARKAASAIPQGMDALAHIRGELRDFRYGPDPTSTTSAHSYIKKLLADAMAETQRYAEPLAVMAASLDRDYAYPHGFFTRVWKKILVSLGHDAASGCSADEVMRDVKIYLTHAYETSARITELALERLAGQAAGPELEDTHSLIIFNPHPYPYTGMTKQVIHMEKGDKIYKDFSIYDVQGNLVPYEILRQWDDVITREFPYNSKQRIFRTCTEVLFKARQVPAMGIKTYKVHKSELLEKREAEFYVRCRPSNPWIENEYYKITVNQDASVNILDKKKNRWYEGMNCYICRGEAGDEYQHVSPLADRHAFAVLSGVSVAGNSPLSKTLQVTARLQPPSGMSRPGVAQCLPDIMVQTDIMLYEDTDRVDFHVEMENNASDYIFYTKFPACFQNACDYSYVSFDEVERGADIRQFNPALRSTQSLLKPMQNYAGVRGGKESLHIMARGIFEYHTKKTQEGLDFYLTLLRSTSYLFHGLPLSWLDGQDSTTPIVETQSSKEIGKVSADYALCLNRESAGLEAEGYVYPLRGTNSFSTAERMTDGALGGVSFLEIDHVQVRISALKEAEDKAGTIVRLYNPENTDVSCKIKTFLPIKNCSFCNLLEEECRKADYSDHEVRLHMEKKKIITLKIQWRT